jgi:hypothetical protein
MSDINAVLERLITDPGFRRQLHEDRAKALEGYQLTADDQELLAAQLTDGGGDRRVEQRTSKSAFAGLASEIFSGISSADVESADFVRWQSGDGADESAAEMNAHVAISLGDGRHAAPPLEPVPDVGSVPTPDTPTGDASASQAGYDDYIEIDSFSFGASQGGDEPGAAPDEITGDAEPENTQVAMETISLNYEEVKVSADDDGAGEDPAQSSLAPDDATAGDATSRAGASDDPFSFGADAPTSTAGVGAELEGEEGVKDMDLSVGEYAGAGSSGDDLPDTPSEPDTSDAG